LLPHFVFAKVPSPPGALDGEAFVRRYSLHVLPERFAHIRHFGYLAPGNRELLRLLQKAFGKRRTGRKSK